MKVNYPVSFYGFLDPTNNPKLQGRQLPTSGQKSFWKMQFRMPALVSGVSVSGNRETNLTNIKVQLLGKSGRIKQQYNLHENRNGRFIVGDVYYVRVERTDGSSLSFTDLKVYGKQGNRRY